MRAGLVTLGFLAACGFDSTPGTPDDAGPIIDAARDAPPPDTNPCVGPDGDGDGKVDVCDPCPISNPDDPDQDGVCAAVDLCEGGDDNADADADTVPDACDTWPCGAAPATLPTTVTWMTPNETVSLSAINAAGMGQRVVATPGQTIDVIATYSIVDCQCVNCIDQIEIGLVPGGKQACLYNGNPQGPSAGMCGTPTTGTATRTLTAPATPGVYSVRFNRGNDTSCEQNGAWWAGVQPGETNTFALLCVR